MRRAVHTICMALDFWQLGGKWPSEELLKREPYAEHRALYQREASIIKSDGEAQSFTMARSGRKHPELIARFLNLAFCLQPREAVAAVM